MTILLVIVFLSFAAISISLYYGSQQRLMDKCKDQLINAECENTHTAGVSILPFFSEQALQELGDLKIEDLVAIVSGGGITEAQLKIDVMLRDLVEKGYLGIQKIVVLVPPIPPFSEDWMVVVSSDDSLVGAWTVPQGLIDKIDAGENYLYEENGFPTWASKGTGSF